MTSTLNMEGEAVRVNLGGGTFMHADVQEVNGDSVKVKGRWFNIANVQTEEEIEQLKRANVEAGRRLRKAEEDAKLAVEAALKARRRFPFFLHKLLTVMKLFRPLLLTFREASIVCIFPANLTWLGRAKMNILSGQAGRAFLKMLCVPMKTLMVVSGF